MAKKIYTLLDLFCGAGGAGVGYSRAGFRVTGVDIKTQPHYPLKFIQADALDYLQRHGRKFDVIHASPPCQRYSRSTAFLRAKNKEYPDLLAPTRDLLHASGQPYIIENVPGAPMRKDVVLRGDMFGLKVLRRRFFEIEGFLFLWSGEPIQVGSTYEGDYVSVFGKAKWKNGSWGNGHKLKDFKYKQPGTIRDTWTYAMGIDWFMKDYELSQAIPPAYTQYIGAELLRQLEYKRKAALARK